MKKLTIGRNNACDIVIPDTSDLVSRKQAVLTYSFFGKMVLYDISNNGTYLNGQKLETGKGVVVTRKDKVNFAQVVDLDWKTVKNPYRQIKLLSVIGASVVMVVACLLTWWLLQPNSDKTKSDEMLMKGESGTTVQQPQSITEDPQPQPVKKQEKKDPKTKKNVTPKDLMNKETNNSTPIIY